MFCGRLTSQKDPQTFMEAMRRVMESEPRCRALVVGTGELLGPMIEQSAAWRLGHRFLFSGFLKRRELEQAFATAEILVMPSRAEPFGLAAAEAAAQGLSVIVPRESGAAEALEGAMTIEPGRPEELAERIAALLRYPTLRQTLRGRLDVGLTALTWERSATRISDVYQNAVRNVETRTAPAGI
jgi:glycosyltransferase involved in cell wall biosynthesis